ncbi:MAG: hypothetical protein V3T31_00430 [candidate division Zixibacteria bacterium]
MIGLRKIVATSLLILFGLALTARGQAIVPQRDTYSGKVRVYIVEPVSRWDDEQSYPYGYGFLSYGMYESISLDSGETWSSTSYYNAGLDNWSGVTQNNIAAIAVVFNSDPHASDAFPPYGYFYTAYYADAAAISTPGVVGYHQTGAGFTHTVFIEEGTSAS